MDYFHDVFENDEDSIPEYLFVCEVNKWQGIDIDNVLENEIEDHHENAWDQIVDIQSIKDFISNWNGKQTLESWNVAYKQKINFKKAMGA